MNINIVTPGSQPLVTVLGKDKRVNRKELLFAQIRELLTLGQTQLKRGNRRLLTPEALRWVERGTPPAKGTDADTLRYVRDILRTIPPLEENLKELEVLRLAVDHWYNKAKALWKSGDGRLLPRTACDADLILRKTKLEDIKSTEELRKILSDLGGKL